MEYENQWIEIEAGVVRQNVQNILSRLAPDVTLMAVIKNNAYGHGLVQTAALLSECGIHHWAVTWLQEALELRQAGIQGEVLLLAPTSGAEETRCAIENDLTLCAASLDDIHQIRCAAQDVNKKACIHLKIETGLSRFGLIKKEEIKEAAWNLSQSPEIETAGAFTHMADATDEDFTKKQFSLFLEAIDILKAAGITPSCLHCANSGVFLRYPSMHLNMVRLGTLLCGQYPAGKYVHALNLKDPFHYKTRIHSVRTLPAKSFLGYKRTWKLKAPAQIAVIPVGYRDGLALTVNNRAEGLLDAGKRCVKILLTQLGMSRFQMKVKIEGRWYPIRGKVFMQMALIELPLSLSVQPGTEVEVPISKTLVSPSVRRIFTEEKEILPGK